jgi:hypothetical protein
MMGYVEKCRRHIPSGIQLLAAGVNRTPFPQRPLALRGGDGRGCSVSPWRSQHCPLRHLCVTSSPRRQELLESRAGPNEKSPGVTGASCAASSSRVWRIVIFRRLRRKTDSSNTAASKSDRCDIFAAPLFPFPRSLSEIAMRGYCAFRACALCATRSVNLNRVLPANRNCASFGGR